MYAKIVTLLALVISSLGGLAQLPQSVRGDNQTNSGQPVESVQLHVSQETISQETISQETRNQENSHSEDVATSPRDGTTHKEEPTDDALTGCHTEDTTPNPDVMNLADQLGVSYESVLSWYCTGYSFDTIQTVYDMSVAAGVTMDQIYDMRVQEGYSWDEVIEELGITFSRGDQPMILSHPDHPRSDK